MARRESSAVIHRRIVSFLRRRDARPADLFLACEWYRRLGMFREGFALLEPKERIRDRRRLLYACRFLNLLGASEFALQLAERLKPVLAEDWRLVGDVYLDNFRYAEARECYVRMCENEKDPSSHAARMGRIALADAFAGERRFVQARSELGAVLAASTEPLVLGICHEARAETFAREGNFDAALTELTLAEPYFPLPSESPDHGYLIKWKAYVQGARGLAAESQRNFERAWTILKRPPYRAEAWLDVLRLRRELGQLDAQAHALLPWYPGLAPGLAALIFSAQDPSEAVFGNESELEIDLARDEYRHQGRLRVGVPTELRLLAYARLAGDWGLALERLKSLLWPGEVHAYLQLEGRLHKLLGRLRQHYDFDLKAREGEIRIAPGARVRVRVAREPQHPSFFTAVLERKGGGDFRAKEVEVHYGIKKTQRAALIKQWRERGWIEPVGDVRSASLVYRMMPYWLKASL